MKKNIILSFLLLFCLNCTGQFKYDFYTDKGVEGFEYRLGEYLIPIFGHIDTSYYYYVSLITNDKDSMLVDLGGKNSRMKNAVLDFFTQNINNIRKPNKGERILIPIYIFDHFVKSSKPVITEDIGYLRHIHSATQPGYVFFVRPFRINFSHRMEVNMLWSGYSEKVTIDKSKLKEVVNRKDSLPEAAPLPFHPKSDNKK